MADIVGIGCAVFDFMLIINNWPEEDTKETSGEAKIQCGGPCAVAMIAASKLGVSSAYVGRIGDDLYGKTIKERLEFYGVDTSNTKVIPGGQSLRCVVLSNQSNSSRTCIGGGGGDDINTVLKPEDIDLEMLRNAKYLHVDGNNLEAAIFAAKKAHEFGVKVCMDADVYRPGFDELLSLVDVLIPSEKFAYSMAGTKDEEAAALCMYNTYKPQTLVMTQGPKGGIIVENGKLTHYDSFKVNAIDTNGAGDVFHGAWIAASVKGMDTYEATRFAAATSAIKCTHFGASEGAPHYEDVVKFLEKN